MSNQSRGRVLCLVLAFCSFILVSSCARQHPNDASSGTTSSSPEAVIGSVAPSAQEEYSDCPGIPRSFIRQMFGEGAEMSKQYGTLENECSIVVNGKAVFYTRYWYLYDNHDEWYGGTMTYGGSVFSFSLTGVDGKGRAMLDTGANARYGSTAFTCGDHYLRLSVLDVSAMSGDMRQNLLNLTAASVPWLCRGQPIPGLGSTMEEIRPHYAFDNAPPMGPEGTASSLPSDS